MALPWYDYPMDSPGGGYGFTEPQCPGCYKKPDTNIAVPSGTPITALLPGVITSSQDLGWNAGGLSVTERLFNPINKLAQYISYNFLGRSSAYVGETVNTGTQIGTAGSSYGVYTAVGLGVDPTWGRGQFLSGTGNPLLNPETNLLDKIRSGQPLPTSSTPTIDCSFCNNLGPMATPCLAACNAGSAAGTAVGSNIAPQQLAVYGQVGHVLQNLTTPSFWVRIGIGVAAIVLIVFALLFFIKDTAPAKGAEHTVEKSALIAA